MMNKICVANEMSPTENEIGTNKNATNKNARWYSTPISNLIFLKYTIVCVALRKQLLPREVEWILVRMSE